MKTRLILLFSCAVAVAAALSWLAPQPAAANPSLRKQVDQRGDFLLIGNTLAHECDGPAPVVGTLGECPGNINPTAADVYFRADDPSDGMARADTSITALQARSTAVLTLPSDAKVTYARIYWGSYAENSSPNPNARLERPGSGLNAALTADKVWALQERILGSAPTASAPYWYQATAEITDIVRMQGSGPYRMSEVSSVPLASLNDLYAYVAWYMVVFYERASEPQRNLALFDGLDLVEPNGSATVTLAGFLVPSSGYDAKLGIVAFEGDESITGDEISFDGTPLQDAQNPATNFFNSTRSLLGSPVSVKGDLPQLTGAPGSMSGLDLDVIGLTSLVKPGQTGATLKASTNSTLETYLLASFITSISTLKPNFQSSQKSVKDVNGGGLKPGDELEYTLDLANHGSDEAVQVVVHDELPKGVTFVPGSLSISGAAGATPAKKTDAAGDDEAEYDAATRTVNARVGAMATVSAGGTVPVDGAAQLHFRVTIDTSTRGPIRNQGTITAAGKLGAPREDTLTDGDPVEPGAQTTDVTVNVCDVNADCKAPTPLCDISSDPQTCVECVTSIDCNDPAKPDCSTQTHTCGCALGAGKCQKDSDSDGISDDGEGVIGTNPNDFDTDDDGTSDGAEFAPEVDSDGDGLPNALDADSDDDGLFDGTEQGFDCSNPATKTELGRCRADTDKAKTKTNPVKADTDRGGVSDGSEDWNLNGAVDAKESDPSWDHSADDKPADRDSDGLSDDLETTLHSNPDDADTDDDGVSDGHEANPSEDTDLDRLVNVLDVDSDNDGVLDGTEHGLDCSAKGTDVAKKHCRADADSGKTKTSALLHDTDHGGVRDGSEDSNADGRVDKGETDPTASHPQDDGQVIDSDGDGVSDGLENTAGSDPRDTDSDDDGVPDGDEPNPTDDQDGDGKNNVVDEDSDGDDLFDGTELGKDCTSPAIDRSRQHCTADADKDATRTGALSKDSDFGGVQDGVEDVDHNGRIDPAELDPNDPDDDVIGKPCMKDPDCGGMMSGIVCKMGMCAFGCRGMGGNTCPSSLYCSSTTNEIGMCSNEPPDAGMPPVTPPPPPPVVIDKVPLAPDGKLGGAGCNCRVVRPDTSRDLTGPGLSVLALLWLYRRRTRKQARQ